MPTRNSVSELIGLAVLLILLSLVVASSSEEENRLKALSVAWVVFLLLTFSTIATEWARMTAVLVNQEDDPHYGLPDLWDGKQVVCLHFPERNVPAGFDDGRHHIDYDGTDFMTDVEWNETGACIGGFSGFENGWDLLDAAINATGDDFAVTTTSYSFGLMIDSIAGVDPSTMAGEFNGAYWSLYHNGALSMVGIADLELDPDSVVTWRVDTW